jgi:hypothetical protein
LSTHDKLDWLKCRSFWIRGSATVTIVPSMIDINWAMQTTTSAIQRPRADLL